MRLTYSLLSVMLGLGSAVFAEPKPVAESSPAAENDDAILPQNPEIPWLATATFGWGLDSDISTWQGGGEILAPIREGENSLFYLNAWTGFYQRDQHYFSVGLGYRWLNPSETLFVGVNAFWDHGEIDNFASFDRLGLGLEVSTKLLDFRLNGYIAEDDRYVAESSNVLEYGSLFAQGNSVFQALTVPGAEAFSGGEIEIGRQLPLPEDFPVTIGLWGGAYAFSGPEEDSQDLDGWRLRAEIGLTDKLFLDAGYYEDEEFVGGNTYVGLRASIPLGKGGTADVGDDSIVENYLRAKLGQRVVRQHRLIHSTTVKHNEEIAKDLIFVNQGKALSNGIRSGSSNGKGTAESPFRSIDDGASRAANRNRDTGRTWSVYTQGGSFVYREDVEVTGSVNFTSSAVPIVGLDGQTFGTGHVPVLDGGFLSRGAGNVGIDSYRIIGGARSSLGSRLRSAGLSRGRGNGIYFENVADFELTNAIIDDTRGSGVVLVNRDHRGRFKITNTTIEDAGGDGLAVFLSRGGVTQGTISGNVFDENAGDGVRVSAAAAVFNSGVTGNLATNNGGDGFDLSARDTGVLNLLLAQNRAERNTNGFRVGAERTQINVEVLANTARGNFEDGFRIEYPDALVVSAISGNIAVSNLGDGFEFENDNGIFHGTISGNLALTNGMEGFLFDLATGNQLRGDILNNIAVGNLGSGFRIFVPRGGLIGDIKNNQAWSNGQHGFAIDASGTRIIGDIEGNISTLNLQDGFHLNFENGKLIGDIIRNTSTLNEGDGFEIILNSGAILGRIASNFAAMNGGHGFKIESVLGTISEGIFDNVAYRNGGSGFYLIFDDFDTTFAGNEARRNRGDGVTLFTVDDFAPTGLFVGNFAEGNGGHGFNFQIGDDLAGPITNNIASGNGGAGFFLAIADDLQNFPLGSFTNNLSEGNQGAGFVILIGEDFEGVVSGNTALGNAGDGFHVSVADDFFGTGPLSIGRFSDNVATGNLGTGISFQVEDFVGRARFVRNSAFNNGLDGINIFVIDDTDSARPIPNLIRFNTAAANGRDGIVFISQDGFDSSRFTNNTARANGRDGIVFLLDPFGINGADGDDIEDGSRFINNTAIGNLGFGFVTGADEQGPPPAGAGDAGNMSMGNGLLDFFFLFDPLGNNVSDP